MNPIGFETFYLISVPGFLVGIMTGRFLAGHRWQALKRGMGRFGKLLGGLGLMVYLAVTLVVLGIMIIYLVNLPDNADANRFWITVMVGFWMVVNILFELVDVKRRKREIRTF